MMVVESDKELVSCLVAGDRMAFDRLLERFERPVFNLAWRMLGNAAEAADATQNVFLKVFEHLGEYRPQYRLFSWIYRIAVNESSDRLQQRKRTCSWEDEAGSGQVTGWESQPDALAGNDQLHDAVQASLMELKQEYRAVIVLRHFSECSYEQMAEILHIPEKTVKSRLYSARQSLREKLCAHGITEA
jgi:RNA polymerase sigma-70 factor (ECF subfamily)